MLATRLATAIVGVPIILALAWFGGPPLWLIAALAAGLAAWEASGLVHGAARIGRLPAPHPNSLPDGEGPCSPSPSKMERGQGGEARPTARAWLVLAVLGAVALVLAAAAGPTAEVAALSLILVVSLALSLVLPSPDANAPGTWASTLAATVYAGLPLALLVSTRQWPGETSLIIGPLGVMDRGAGWVLLTLTAVWAVDTAAYSVGRLAGRRRLWPRISPNKTWEGTSAGILAGIVVCEAWASALQIGVGVAFVLGVALAGSAVIGDLAESALKRAARVKDAGALLPGHGGLLDRIDSLAFSAIVVFLWGILGGSAGTHALF